MESTLEARPNGYHSFVDLLKALAIALVLLDHNCGFAGNLGEYSIGKWIYADLLKTLSKPAVPLFLMCMGFTLVKPIENTLQFYKKRLHRIAIPFLFWCVVYLQVRVHLEGNQISLLSSIRSIWIGDVYYHMWFMYILFGAYITIPFISSFNNGRWHPRSLITGFTVIWFAYFHLIPAFAQVLELRLDLNFKPGLHLNFFSGYIGYLTLGYLLGNMSRSRNRLYLAIALFLLSWVFVAVGSYIIEIAHPEANSIAALLNPASVVMAASVFLLIRLTSPSSLPKWIRVISKQTLGIYLAHPLIMIGLRKLPLTAKFFESDLFLLRASFLLVVSCALVVLVSKIPLVKRTVI